MRLIVILLVLSVEFESKAQNFPGGLVPMEDRSFVTQRIAVQGNLGERMTNDLLFLATSIRIEGITFTKNWIFFQSDKLVAMGLQIPTIADRAKVIKILKSKYKKETCTSSDDIMCFRNKNLSINITKDYTIVYRYEKEETF